MISEQILGNDSRRVPIILYLAALLVVGKHLHCPGQQLMKKLHSSSSQMQRIRQLDEHTFNKPIYAVIKIKCNKHIQVYINISIQKTVHKFNFFGVEISQLSLYDKTVCLQMKIIFDLPSLPNDQMQYKQHKTRLTVS